MQIWYYSVCLRMLVCTDAWRLLLYFVDDLVAIGRGEAIDTMAYSADNGCRAVTAFPFQCTNAWLSFYMYISFFIPFELLYCFYYCLYLSEVTNKVVQSIKFHDFFIKIGPNLTKHIIQTDGSHISYMKYINLTILSSFNFQLIDDESLKKPFKFASQ